MMVSLEDQAMWHPCNATCWQFNICFSFVLVHVALWNKVNLTLLRLGWCLQHICHAGLEMFVVVTNHVSAITTRSLTPKGVDMRLGPSNSICLQVIYSAIYAILLVGSRIRNVANMLDYPQPTVNSGVSVIVYWSWSEG